MAPLDAPPPRTRILSAIVFTLAALAVIALVGTDQQASALLPLSVWVRLHLAEFPYKMTVVVPFLLIGATLLWYLTRKAQNVHVFLIVITFIGLQTNGIKVLLVTDLLVALPFFVILYLLAESLRRPSFQIIVPGVMYFGMLLLLLDIPYLAAAHIYGPARFIINFISILKGILVAFIFVNLLRTEHDLRFAIQVFMIVAVVSASIGVAQILLEKFTGIAFNFVSEEAEKKPTLLGFTLRATGLTTWASWLSDFLVLAVPFVLLRLFDASSLRWRVLYLLALAVMLVAIFFTFTYAAYFAVAAIFALFPFVRWPHRTVHFVVTLLLVAGLFQIGGGFEWAYERGLGKVLQSAGMIERKTYLQSTLNEIARHPWVGSGIYAEEEFSENFYRKRVHNAGLQAWADLGLPGLLVFLALMLTVLTQVSLLAFTVAGPGRRVFQALGLGIIGSILEMFAEPNLTVAVTWFHLGLCQAAVLIYCTYRYPRRLAPAAASAPHPA